LQECTLGLLGFGRIGQATARRAQSFGLNVRWYDPYVPRGQDKVTRTTRVENLPDLLQDCDALSIHCSLNHETRHMIDAAALALLPPHAMVVNTARGPVIDEQALYEALRTGRLAAAALDVLQHEPPVENALFDAYLRGELQNLLLTPHIAWYSQQSARELRRKAAEEAGRLLRGDPPYNVVT
jgi:phosphoglycerate dehydrogenase-like enzyme